VSGAPWNDPYGVWAVTPEEGWVRLSRTNRRYATLDEVGATFGALVLHLDGLAGNAAGLLVDFRRGPEARLDPEFEAASAPWRNRLFRRYARAAVLIRTKAGLEQLTRSSREDGDRYAVFDDEAAAIAYVRGED
jgi:hypothetical protein